MCYFLYFYNLFSSKKINPEPSSNLDLSQEKNNKNKLSLSFEYIESPALLSLLFPIDVVNETSITCSFNHLRIYKIIYYILIPYDPYFNSYENYWLIINKELKRHRSIKISLYQNKENEIIIDCFSMDKDDVFWKIYHLLRKHCNNIKKSVSFKNNNICEKKFCKI